MSNYLFKRKDPARLLFVKVAIKVDPLVANAVVRSLQSTSPSMKRQWLRDKMKNPTSGADHVNTEWTTHISEHLSTAIALQIAANAQISLINSTSSVGQQCAYAHNLYAHEARLASLLSKFKTSSVYGSLLNSVLKPLVQANGTMVIPVVCSKDVNSSLLALSSVNPSNLGMMDVNKVILFDEYSENALSVGSTADLPHLQTLLTSKLTNGEYKDWNAEWNDDMLASGVLAGRLFKVSGVSEFMPDGSFKDVDMKELYTLPRGSKGLGLSTDSETTILNVSEEDVQEWWFSAFAIQTHVPFKSNSKKEGV